jgi:hypothetical protein
MTHQKPTLGTACTCARVSGVQKFGVGAHDSKMPFKFEGTIEKVEVGPDQLTPQQRGELERLKRDFATAVQ